MKYYFNLFKNKQVGDAVSATVIALFGICTMSLPVLYFLQQIIGINPFGLIPIDLSEVMNITHALEFFTIGIIITYFALRCLPAANMYAWDWSEIQLDIHGEILHIGYENYYWEIDRAEFVEHGVPRKDKSNRKISQTKNRTLGYIVKKKAKIQGIRLYPKGTLVDPEDFYGKRQIQDKEEKYLKVLLLQSLEGAGIKAYSVVMFLVSIGLFFVGIELLGYIDSEMDIASIVVCIFASLCLVVMGIVGGYASYQESIGSLRRERIFKENVINGHFSAAEVDIVKIWSTHNKVTRIHANVKDCMENFSEYSFDACYEDELKKSGKGLVVFFEKKNKKTGEKMQEVHKVLFPLYDENSPFCIAWEKEYQKLDKKGALGKYKIGFSIASLLLGLLAITFCSRRIGLAGVITAIISVKRHENQRFAVIAGIILSCFGIVLGFTVTGKII